MYSKKGFTLVELIVVITILAILGTLGYVSLLGIIKTSRDSTRISDVNTIHKALSLQITKGNPLPTPDNLVDISMGESSFSHQGYFGQKNGESVKVFGELKDPLTGENYIYALNSSKNKYQIAALEENVVASHLIPTTHASNDNKLLISKGFPVGLIFDEAYKPIHSLSPYSTTGKFDLYADGQNIILRMFYGKDTAAITGTGGLIAESNNRSSCKKLISSGYAKESGEYTISEAGKDILVYCDLNMPDTNFYTTIQDGDFENSYANNWPSSKITKKEIAGNTLGEVVGFTGGGVSDIISNNFTYIQPGKEYTLSGDFKSIGSIASRFYYGFVEYDKDFNVIFPSFAFGYEGTESILSRPFTNEDSRLYFEDTDEVNCQKWVNNTYTGSLAVAFDVDPSGNLGDIPNKHVTHSYQKVSSIQDIGNECVLHFSENMRMSGGKSSFPTGTHIRGHKFYGSYNYVAAAYRSAPSGEFQNYAGTIQGISDNITARVTHFRKGTKFVKIVILPNYKQDDNSILHIDNLRLETH